jgi:uncharacterized protein YqeY
MSLEEKINADIKTAMLARDQNKLEALRGIKSAILLLKTSPEGLTPETESKALQKMVKQRKEAGDIYKTQNRPELAEVELFQASVIETYLPKLMGEDEVRKELQAIIQSVGAAGPGDMGKVMGVATKQLAGKAEGKMISSLVKELLTK